MGDKSTPPPADTSLEAAVGEIDSLVHDFTEALHKRLDDLLGTADDRTLGHLAVTAERCARSIEAAAVKIVADIDQRALYLTDGHRNAKSWIMATVRISKTDTGHRHRLARLTRLVPSITTLLADGDIGIAQVRELARLLHNPRIADEHIAAAAEHFIDWARHDDHDTFVAKVRDWEHAVDADGAHLDHDTAHRGRSARIATVGDTTYLDLRCGNLQGDVIRQILDAFTDAEFRADCDHAHRNPDDTNRDSTLARTPAQRRADALYAMALAAAGAPLEQKPIDVVVNLVCDQTTFETTLTGMVDPTQRPATTTRLDGCGFDGDVEHGPDRFCRTLAGHHIDPAAAVAAALVGHVRRVVVGAGNVIIDLGRRTRCFTGSTRDAVFLQAAIDRIARCIWPGCWLPHVQIDHTTPWADNGPTASGNGDLLCRHHNVLKTSGYTTRRDHHGRWHTYRPDGTEITAA